MPLPVFPAARRPRRLHLKPEGLPWQEAAALLGLCAWLAVVSGGMAGAGSGESPVCCRPRPAGPEVCCHEGLGSQP